jgi:beta-galactosidase
MPAGDSEKMSKAAAGLIASKLRDTIIYNRNNPSILFYEGGNKGISEDHQRQLNAVRDQLTHWRQSFRLPRNARHKVMMKMLYINKAQHPHRSMEYSR